MKQRPRLHITAGQKALTWEQGKKGYSPRQIAQDLIATTLDTAYLAQTGPIYPLPEVVARCSKAFRWLALVAWTDARSGSSVQSAICSDRSRLYGLHAQLSSRARLRR